ncbi:MULTISPECIES: histidine phosphatase family protein [Desulfococcus]|uniref:Phosphoglycerate mutase n=1 Tax=Desulfococcus multivorans DSM 2059 TaxID=1121405 RepID=S7V3K7_DESML|nr:histidine phosphatase family protein [Desulfococcus multivorans]AOY60312.1 GpmB: hosphoglycerate mutase [Desulfococcus multivorans]AQV02418.1 histidine phosphatase family protein [Desulfococcus multivorans]EPR39238.1 Phosphoglycerate mutase [Desulfococcus multivorans DSM 2059]SJZ58578.1 probable phosphoglycerate mutase [Desulfococcus multivorans DSM 2059]
MNESPALTRFGVLRHAPTVWNLEKRIQGQLNSPLTGEGERMAREWGRLLRRYAWDRILVSDLGRTLRTAELINRTLGLPMTVDPRLREKDWGEWAGKTIDQLRQQAGDRLAAMERDGWRFRPPGGEDRTEVWSRGHQALVDAAARWPGRKILVVTHEGMIKCLVYRLTNRHFFPTEPPLLRRGHLHQLVHDREGMAVEALNVLALWIDTP